jgi:hypothetical protein
MALAKSSFRIFVTLLLAVAVPFCCCNFHLWLNVCVPCEAATRHEVVEPVAHFHEDRVAHNHETDRPADRITSFTDGHGPSPSPCGPGHEDDNDCTCGKQHTLVAAAKLNLDLPAPVLVAILSFPGFADVSALPTFRAIERELWLSPRPATTLLRLHCALVV